MKIVSFEFHSRRRQIVFWCCVAVIGLILIAGPYLAAAFEVRGAQQSQQNSTQLATLQRTANGVQALLAFVAKVQSGGQSQESAWYVEEFQSICAAVHCVQVPPPPSLAPPRSP